LADVASTPDETISATLQHWADRELSHWRAQALRRVKVERQLHNLCGHSPGLRLYHVSHAAVTLQKPQPGGTQDAARDRRAMAYLSLFQAAAPLLPRDFNATICVSVDDMVIAPALPVFGFQKIPGEHWPLLPDVDFVLNTYHEAKKYRDVTPYEAKAPRAVFAGATTGGRISRDVAQRCETPRLRAARFFQNRIDVDFRLPHIAQVADDAARAILQAYSFCQRPRLTWPEQFQSRFLLSMDGNGATCSRVAVALASHSVLLKYHSACSLYYFQALVPHVHYVPILRNEDVLDVLAAERAEPGRYRPMTQAANAFAADYLTRARVVDYTVRLLVGYAAALHETDAAETDDVPRRVAAGARAANGATSLNDQHEWLGNPGSGIKLTAFKVLTQPRSEAPRILYQAMLDDGRFTTTAIEGAWCQGDDEQGLTGIILQNARGLQNAHGGQNARGLRPVRLAVDARFTDGSFAHTTEMGVACRSESGAPLEAFRVQFA
jgi:hypothetical protein